MYHSHRDHQHPTRCSPQTCELPSLLLEALTHSSKGGESSRAHSEVGHISLKCAQFCPEDQYASGELLFTSVLVTFLLALSLRTYGLTL